MTNKQNLKDLNFEDALTQLETIVRDLESGKAPLADSISKYEEGVALKNHCEKRLKEAQEKIEKITVQPDGTVKAENLDN